MKRNTRERKNSFIANGFARLVFIYAAQNIALSITGIIDTAAVGRFIGEEGLAAMKLALPVFSVIGLFGNVMSSGLSIQVSREIAKGRSQRAAQSFLGAGTLSFLISLLFLLAGLFFPEQTAAVLNVNGAGGSIPQQMTDYLIPILIGTLPILSYYILSTMVALEGGEKYITASSAAILCTDILGDLLAVKMNWGLKGIAAASVAAYLAADAALCVCFFRHHTILQKGGEAGNTRKCLWEVLRSGLPMAVKNVCTILGPILINYLMLKYGTMTGLAALSIQDAVHYVPEALCKGISSTVLLLTGMLITEQDQQMLKWEKDCVMRYSIIAGLATAAVMGAFARPILSLFTEDPALIRAGTSALRWYLLSVPFACINFAVTAYLQSMKKRRAANAHIVFSRLLIPVIMTWLLGKLWGMEGIYASFAVSEAAAALLFGVIQLVRYISGNTRIVGTDEWDELIDEMNRDVRTIQQATEVSEDIFNMCLAHRIDRKQAGQIALCMEELSVNSIQHGFADEKSHHIEVRFMVLKDRLILRLRDNGRYYDLTEQDRLLNPEDPAAHIGLRLVFGCADEVSYSHALQLNNVCIRVARQDS